MSQKSMYKLLSILIFSFTLISFSINFFADKIKQIEIPLHPPLIKGEENKGGFSILNNWNFKDIILNYPDYLQ
jgi:hypothetical protein